MKQERTKVIFRKWKEGDIIALFPAIAGDAHKPETCLSYQHIGQHGSASADLASVTKPATPSEYKALATELERQGYQLKVVKRMTRQDYKEREKQANP